MKVSTNNFRVKTYTTINSLQMQSLLNNNDVIILDVRNPGEFRNGHIPDAINIPLNDILGRLAEINSYKNNKVIVYCASGVRSAVASDLLIKNGFKEVYNLRGGIHSYNGRIVK